MHRAFAHLGALTALAVFAAADAATGGGTGTAEAVKESIVPNKYAGKYKNGGDDALAVFIKEQCTGKEGFEFSAFFTLCRVNGLPEEKVSMYETQVSEKQHGAPGRARMTLRNMLATIVRKDSKLKGLDKKEHDVALPKVAVTGAAAKAKDDAAGKAEADAKIAAAHKAKEEADKGHTNGHKAK